MITRTCPECGVDLSGEHPNRLRCTPCANKARWRRAKGRLEADPKTKQAYLKRLRENQAAYRVRTRTPRYCVECNASIEGTGRRWVCASCQPEFKKRQQREHAQKKRDAARQTRHCLDCGCNMESYASNRKRCDECRPKRLAELRIREKQARQHRLETDEEFRKAYRANTAAWLKDKWRSDPEWREKRRIAGSAWRGKVSRQDVEAMLKAQGGKCAECGKSIQTGYHMDHITPQSRSGESTLANLQLLCRSCNSSKGCQDPIEFARRKGRLL